MKASPIQSAIVLCLTLLGLMIFGGSAVAQFGHSDVDLGLEGSKIITDKRVYESNFPTTGISKQFNSNPGFAAESDGLGTLGGSYDLFYNVLDNLLLWDGSDFVDVPETTQIRISNNPPGSGSTFVGADTGEQLGSSSPPINRIGASSGAGEVHSHVNFFLQDEEDLPAQGAYGIKLSVEADSVQLEPTEPIFLVFNYGLDVSVFDEALVAYEALLDESQITGDFDGSGLLDVADIDLLTEAVMNSSGDLQFDVNQNGQVDPDDRRFWVEELRQSYFGDANLDGEFSSADFVTVFQVGEYEDSTALNSGWGAGDWNGDGEFDSGDFVMAFQAGGYEVGPRAATAAVPEPSAIATMMLGALLLISRRRRAY